MHYNTQSYAPDRAWPSTWSERHAAWVRRRAVYRGGEYGPADFERMYLFQGTNAAGYVIAKTRRISTMSVFLVTMDAACIGAALSLEVAPTVFTRAKVDGMDAPRSQEVTALEAGQAIMRRAMVDDLNREWTTALCSEGDLYFEVGFDDSGAATFYPLQPETVTVYWDKYGRRPERAVIAFDYTPSGKIETVRYERTITADRVDAKGARTKGRIVTKEGGVTIDDVENVLGVVTVIHVPFSAVPGSKGFSKCAFSDVEDVVAKADSASTQMGAIGTRVADPVLLTKGFQISDTGGDEAGTGAKSTAMAKTLPMDPDDDASYLEVTLTGAGAINMAAEADLAAARATLPEFMFSESGANSSGLAMSYRATALVGKLEPIQKAYRAALARMVGMCRALDLGVAWDDAADIYVMGGAPVLPMDIAAEFDVALKAHESGAMTLVDLIRFGQRLGLIDAETDPADYATLVREERQAADESAVSMLDRVSGGRRAAPVRDLPDSAIEADDDGEPMAAK